MGLLDTQAADVQTAEAIKRLVKQQYTALGQVGQQGWSLIWRHPILTPAQVVAALGTDAKVIFELANLNASTIDSAAQIAGTLPHDVPGVPDGYTVTFNADGSGVVTKTTPQIRK